MFTQGFITLKYFAICRRANQFFFLFPKMVTGQSRNGYFETKMVTTRTPLKCTPQRKLIRFILFKISGSRRNITKKRKKKEEINVLKIYYFFTFHLDSEILSDINLMSFRWEVHLWGVVTIFVSK